MGGLAVTTRELSRSYLRGGRTIEVLRAINLDLEPGSFTVLTGPSGAGKSTLLHLLGTLDRPTSGEILYDGHPAPDKKDRDLATFRREKIGFIFQFHHLLPEFSAMENVLMPTWISGKDREDREWAKTLLEEVGLGSRLDHKPSELSGGEQQRVAVARALVMKPSLLLADEPTGNLDSHTGLEVFTLLQTLSRRFHMTCLLTTHNEALTKKADRHIAMDDGQIRLF